MALNYAESWSNELLEIRRQNSITSPFITQNVKWLNSKTFHFTLMSTSGFKNHSRAGGWNRGTYSQTDYSPAAPFPYRMYWDLHGVFFDIYHTGCNDQK